MMWLLRGGHPSRREGLIPSGEALMSEQDDSVPAPVQDVRRETDEERSRRAVNDVQVELSVVLGRARMPINQLLKMGRGAVIELNTTVEDDVWVYANNKLIARGEITVIGENIGVSITQNVTSSEE
jgi:flagellar motor switch protein FliN/FliY